MLTAAHVNELVATMIANGVETLEMKGADYSVRLVRASGSGAVVCGSGEPETRRAVSLSPASGAFHPRGGDDGFAALARGAPVRAGEPLGYVAIGSARLLCAAPASGRLRDALPPAGTPVNAGEPLASVETAETAKTVETGR